MYLSVVSTSMNHDGNVQGIRKIVKNNIEIQNRLSIMIRITTWTST